MTLKEKIRRQIGKHPEGEVFILDDLKFEKKDRPSVTAIVSLFKSEGMIKSAGKGMYYRPKVSFLGVDPISQKSLIEYYLRAYDGYLSGNYAYNHMGLTEQVPSIVTIATESPRRILKFSTFAITFTKAYASNKKYGEKVLRILDAAKDAENIPGTTKYDICRNLQKIISLLSNEEKDSLFHAALNYPPGTRYTVAGMVSDEHASQLLDSIRPDTLRKLEHAN